MHSFQSSSRLSDHIRTHSCRGDNEKDERRGEAEKEGGQRRGRGTGVDILYSFVFIKLNTALVELQE